MTAPLRLLALSLAVAVVAPVVAAPFSEGKDLWGAVIGAYSGGVLAFTTALFWDRHSRLRDELRAVEAERRRAQERLHAEQERRAVEAKRRLGAVLVELERLERSIDRTRREQREYKQFFPDLPTGSWTAARVPLGAIVADYELMADLTTFYGHVEELRWRLRFKAEPDTDEQLVDPLIDALVAQMAEAVDMLLEQVREQVEDPDVEQLAGAPPRRRAPVKRVSRTRQLTGAIRVQTPPV